MRSHGPKRFYTPNSLEFWFSKLAGEWATAFTPSQLEEGRRIYRAGEVRELELTDRDAIIHRRIDKREEYAVIEWNMTGMAVRSSTTDAELARALAVAGLHEIEELVADEISPLPDGASGGRGGDEAASEGSAPPGPDGAVREIALAPSGTPSHPPRQGPMRTLLLVFKTRTAGLTFQAHWIDSNGGSRVPALGQGAHANGNGHVSSAERAKLIGLAAYARKAHFQYDQASGVYLLESLVEIPNFLRTALPAWRRVFAVDFDEKAARLLLGTRAIEIEAVAEWSPGGSIGSAPGGAGLNLRWIFRAGERLLNSGEVAALLKRGAGP